MYLIRCIPMLFYYGPICYSIVKGAVLLPFVMLFLWNRICLVFSPSYASGFISSICRNNIGTYIITPKVGSIIHILKAVGKTSTSSSRTHFSILLFLLRISQVDF